MRTDGHTAFLAGDRPIVLHDKETQRDETVRSIRNETGAEGCLRPSLPCLLLWATRRLGCPSIAQLQPQYRLPLFTVRSR